MRRFSSSCAPAVVPLCTYSVTTVVMLTTVMLLRTTTWFPELDAGGGDDVGGCAAGDGELGALSLAAVVKGSVVVPVVAHCGVAPQQIKLQFRPLAFDMMEVLSAGKEQVMVQLGGVDPAHTKFF